MKIFVWMLVWLLLGILISSETNCNCQGCKEIPTGAYSGNWTLVEPNSDRCIDNGCLYVNADNGDAMCFCDPGSIEYVECEPDMWLVLTGGETNSQVYENSSVVISYTGECRPDIKPLPKKIARGQMVWTKDTLVYCGGDSGMGTTRECWSFKKGDPDWSNKRLCGLSGCSGGRRNDMNEPRSYFSLTAVNNEKIIAVGGATKMIPPSLIDTIEVYSYVSHTWKIQSQKLVNARQGHCAVLYYEGATPCLIIIGGSFETFASPPTASVIKINLETWEINPMRNLPIGLFRPACIIVHNKDIYVSGGQTSTGSSSTTVYKYSFASGWWSLQGNLTTGRRSHIMGITAQNQMVVAGGYDEAASQYVKSIEDSTDDGATWSVRIHNLPNGRKSAAMAEVPANSFPCTPMP